MMQILTKRSPSHATLFALGFITVLALVVRLQGIQFGLPNTLCRPDEDVIVAKAVASAEGDCNPRFFRYPTLFMYLVGGVFRLYASVCPTFTGVPVDLSAEAATAPTNLFVMARVLSATFGAASVVMVWLVARRLFGPRVGLVSSLLLALCYLHVRDSHFATTDVTMTFFALCSVFFAVRAVEESRVANYIWAGVYAGLATGTKYGGVFLAVPIVIAHLCKVSGFLNSTPKGGDDGSPGQRSSSWMGQGAWHLGLLAVKKLILHRGMWVFGCAATAAFVLSTPFCLVEHKQFLTDVRAEAEHLVRGHGAYVGLGWVYHAKCTLRYGMGLALFVVSLMGILLLVWQKRCRNIVLLSFPLVFYVVSGRGFTVFVRYMIPVVPFLCIAAAVFVEHVAGRLRDLRMRNAAAAAMIGLMLVESCRNVVLFNNMISRADNRLIVAEWMREHMPTGTTIHQAGYGCGHAQLPPKVLCLDTVRAGTDGAYADYVLTLHSPLDALYENFGPSLELRETLDESYELVNVFRAYDEKTARGWYDQLDAFYVPFVNFHGVNRPGPNFFLYRQKHR